MSRRFARAVAVAAIVAGSSASARAGQILTTSPVPLDLYDKTMTCNAVNAGTATLRVSTRFYDLLGGLVSATPAVALAPGEGTSHAAPVGKFVAYCKFVVKSGFASDVRATGIVSHAGHYETAIEAR